MMKKWFLVKNHHMDQEDLDIIMKNHLEEVIFQLEVVPILMLRITIKKLLLKMVHVIIHHHLNLQNHLNLQKVKKKRKKKIKHLIIKYLIIKHLLNQIFPMV